MDDARTTRTNRGRWLIALGVLLLTACGGGGGGGSSTSGTAAPATTTPPPTASPPAASTPPATSPPPATADVTGTWTLKQTLKSGSMGMDCGGHGVVQITSSGGALAGTSRWVSTCSDKSGRRTGDDRDTLAPVVSGDSIEFVVDFGGFQGANACRFTGTLSGSPPAAAQGSVACSNGWGGTWQAVRGAATAARLGTVAAVDVADMTACAVATDGRVACWGPNHLGQAGSGDALPAIVPVGAAAGLEFRRVSVSTGGGHACGIATSGQAYCWGNQEGGRLGDGVKAPSWQFVGNPVPVSGSRSYVDIAAGGDHVCAVASDGAAYCWGHNGGGQLGTGDRVDSAVPVAVTGGLRFRSITTHQLVSCGITEAGAAYCWGNGRDGRLGDGLASTSAVPVAVKGGLTFAALSAGLSTTCGVATSGDGYCWGADGVGELGMGTIGGTRLEPSKVVGGLTWRSISAGVASTCGVATDGRGYCWGGNSWGERGDGPFPAADKATPVPIAGDLRFASIDTDWHACGVTTDGHAYCWGPGFYGSIGDGTLENRGVPTLVAGQD